MHMRMRHMYIKHVDRYQIQKLNNQTQATRPTPTARSNPHNLATHVRPKFVPNSAADVHGLRRPGGVYPQPHRQYPGTATWWSSIGALPQRWLRPDDAPRTHANARTAWLVCAGAWAGARDSTAYLPNETASSYRSICPHREKASV